jgi:hypothetical protein
MHGPNIRTWSGCRPRIRALVDAELRRCGNISCWHKAEVFFGDFVGFRRDSVAKLPSGNGLPPMIAGIVGYQVK